MGWAYIVLHYLIILVYFAFAGPTLRYLILHHLAPQIALSSCESFIHSRICKAPPQERNLLSLRGASSRIIYI